MTENTTPAPNVAQKPAQWPQSALYEHPTCITCQKKPPTIHTLYCRDCWNKKLHDLQDERARETFSRSQSDLDIEHHNAIADFMETYDRWSSLDRPPHYPVQPRSPLSQSDLDIELHTLMDEHREYITTDNPYTAELIREYMDNNANTTLAIQHALIELQTAQDDLQAMTGDIYDLLVLDRRLTVIRTLLEGVTT